MIPMAQIDHALVRLTTTRNITHYVGAFLPIERVLHLHTNRRWQVEGLKVGLLRLGDQLIQVVAIIRQELTSHLLLNPAVQRTMVGLAVTLHIHLRTCGGSNDRPRITSPSVLMDNQDAFHALPCALFIFIHPATIVGHDVAIEIALVRAAQPRVVHDHDRYLILRVLNARIIILAILRCHYAVTGEEKRSLLQANLRLNTCGKSGVAL